MCDSVKNFVIAFKFSESHHVANCLDQFQAETLLEKKTIPGAKFSTAASFVVTTVFVGASTIVGEKLNFNSPTPSLGGGFVDNISKAFGNGFPNNGAIVGPGAINPGVPNSSINSIAFWSWLFIIFPVEKVAFPGWYFFFWCFSFD